MSLLYRALRAIFGLALRLFYRIESADPSSALGLEGPVMYVGNHPNGMIDPVMVGIVAQRQVTFMAKAPLFSIPVLGFIMRRIGALPVYRKQDDPTQMSKNSGTLEAAAGALLGGRCITIFPEGKSHSEPQLAELKTGAARIALMAAAKGAKVRIVPLGLTYSEKNRFRSAVHVDIGAPIEVKADEDALALTDRIFEALRAVTLNLEAWEDLPLIQTAETLYALKVGEQPQDPERLRAFARGMKLLRDEQPDRFQRLKGEVLSVRRRLSLVNASPQELSYRYHPGGVAKFVFRNLLALALLPLFALGMVLFFVPFWIPPLTVRVLRVAIDVQATIKVMLIVLLTPLWLALLTGLAWRVGGPLPAAVTLASALPLAMFTRYYFERRREALRDARTFFVLGSRANFKSRLEHEGEALAAQIEQVADELRPRVTA